MAIHLILADDWEIRGDGSGNPEKIQFDTINKLIDVYDKYGIKGTFNVEVMQQLLHKKYASEYPELDYIQMKWEETVIETFKRGHDIQLHIHPQWLNATYSEGKWKLVSDWNITNHSPEIIDSLVKQGVNYLESLLKPYDKTYSCVSYRGGSWAIAPSSHMLNILADNNIVFDMSIVKGLYREKPFSLDYRHVEEAAFPYYPDMKDARKIGAEKTDIICVPTHSLRTRINIRSYLLQKLNRIINNSYITECMLPYLPGTVIPINNAGYNLKTYSKQFKNNNETKNIRNHIKYLTNKNYRTTDLSALSYFELITTIKDIRKKAKFSKREYSPFIFASHTKNLGNFHVIELFAKYLSSIDEIKVITASQLADNLKNNLYEIKMNPSS